MDDLSPFRKVDLVTSMNKKFSLRKSKFMVDKYIVNPKNVQSKLKAIRLQFFPSQPLGIGIIKNLKQYFRHNLVSPRLKDSEDGTFKGQFIPDFSHSQS